MTEALIGQIKPEVEENTVFFFILPVCNSQMLLTKIDAPSKIVPASFQDLSGIFSQNRSSIYI